MIHAKNYETACTFVQVIQRKLLSSFFRTRCIYKLGNCLSFYQCSYIFKYLNFSHLVTSKTTFKCLHGIACRTVDIVAYMLTL